MVANGSLLYCFGRRCSKASALVNLALSTLVVGSPVRHVLLASQLLEGSVPVAVMLWPHRRCQQSALQVQHNTRDDWGAMEGLGHALVPVHFVSMQG